MQFEALCQVDHDTAREAAFDAVVRAGPWRLATLEGLLAREPTPLAAVLVHDAGPSIERALAHVSEAGRAIAVIGYRETIDAAAVVDALHAGAVDYLAWPLESATLPSRLELAARRADRRLRTVQLQHMARHRIGLLSPRERQVLDNLASGGSNKAIAQELGISPRTVEIHRANMLRHLGVPSTAAAIALATTADLLSVSPD